MSSITEPLIADHILKFSHHSDWKISKPYLICKQFNSVFNNSKFAKEYLINLFQLSEYQLAILNEVIDYFSSSSHDEKPKKKRKKESYQNVDDVHVEILKLYVKCNMKHTDSEIKRANKKLQGNFEKIMKREEFSRFDFTVNMKEIISNFKGIFMIDYEMSTPGLYSYGGIDQNSEFVLFTHCGFPLIFKNSYSTQIDLDHCSCDVTESFHMRNICEKSGKYELFFKHSLCYSAHNGTDMMYSKYNERLFDGIVMALFHPENTEFYFDNEQTFEKEKMLGTILYHLLNCSLVGSENAESFFGARFKENEHDGLPLYSEQ